MFGCETNRPECGSSQGHGAFRKLVDESIGRTGNLVEEFVQGDELSALHVPVGLLSLAMEIARGREGFVQQTNHFRACLGGEIVFGGMKFRSHKFCDPPLAGAFRSVQSPACNNVADADIAGNMSRPRNKTMLGIILGFAAFWLVVFIINLNSKSVAGGVVNGRLAPCPATPNCVSSTADDPAQAIEPFKLSGDVAAMREKLKAALSRLGSTTMVKEETNYLHVVASTAFFRFRDDLELLIDPANGVVHIRSASRIGVSDLGANRKRVEHLRKILAN